MLAHMHLRVQLDYFPSNYSNLLHRFFFHSNHLISDRILLVCSILNQRDPEYGQGDGRSVENGNGSIHHGNPILVGYDVQVLFLSLDLSNLILSNIIIIKVVENHLRGNGRSGRVWPWKSPRFRKLFSLTCRIELGLDFTWKLLRP